MCFSHCVCTVCSCRYCVEVFVIYIDFETETRVFRVYEVLLSFKRYTLTVLMVFTNSW